MGRLTDVAERYGVLRAAKFGIAGIVGFAVAEAIIIVGLFLANGTLEVPSGYSSSPTLLAVDVVAFVVGVTVGFFMNERTTVKDARNNKTGSGGTALRLAKYQGVYVLGNAITIGTQLVLLAAFALSPAIGVMVGAVVAYPVSYEISMRFVWKV